MRQIAIVMLMLAMNSCAYYSLQITTPEGLVVSGRAFVLNESDDVSLTVESATYSATFGKQGTDASTVTELVGELAETIRPPGLL